MDKEPYRYLGDIATTVCPNGHFSVHVHPLRECKTCGKMQASLRILTKLARIPVYIDGYLARNGDAVVYTIGVKEPAYWSQSLFLKNHVVLDVVYPELLITRLFSWGIVTRVIGCKNGD